MEQTAEVELEKFVDLHGLPKTLDMLADICAEKAEHLRTNWQDEGAEMDWDRAYKLILKVHAALRRP